MDNNVDPNLQELMKKGGYFYKHDYGRAKRSRKHLKLSTDGLKITWKAVGANEVVPDGSGTDRGSSPAKSILRSASFSRTTSSAQQQLARARRGGRRARAAAQRCWQHRRATPHAASGNEHCHLCCGCRLRPSSDRRRQCCWRACCWRACRWSCRVAIPRSTSV